MTFTSPCANSPKGAGALICISLHPSGAGRKRPHRSSPSPKGNKIPAADAPRVLIVEDLLLAAWHLESLLIDLNFEVCGIAANGEDAIEQAADSGANVVLVDLNLGEGIDGIETASRIRRAQPAALVFITAYSDKANLERIAQAFPGAPVLTKPVTRDGLHRAITVACTTYIS